MDDTDFTKIQGIGIKVSEILKLENILTYTDLINTPVHELKQILIKHNMSKFRDPSAWPSEAQKLLNNK